MLLSLLSVVAGEPWYGQGVYFAKDASYSMRSWMTQVDSSGKEASLFLVKVLTGNSILSF